MTMDFSRFENIEWEIFSCEEIIAKYNCKYCDYVTQLWVNLNAHIWSRHKKFRSALKINIYACKNCDFTSYSLLVWRLHVEKCKSKEEDRCDYKKKRRYTRKIQQCSQCSYKTNLLANLKRHINLKHDRKNLVYQYKCTQCPYKSWRKNNLDSHIFAYHTDKWFECAQCEFRTKYRRHLKTHISFKHTRESLVYHECSQCDFKSIHKSSLISHIKLIHARLVYYECSHCSLKTVYKKSLKIHIAACHADPREIRWFKCHDCEYKAKQKSSLKKHIWRMHVCKNYKCRQCSDVERRIGARHTDPEQTKCLECQSSGYRTIEESISTNYFTREQIQKNLERYKCSQCPFVTIEKRYLRSHLIARHTDPEEIKWFYCDHCGYKTKRSFTLKRHINSKHS